MHVISKMHIHRTDLGDFEFSKYISNIHGRTRTYTHIYNVYRGIPISMHASRMHVHVHAISTMTAFTRFGSLESARSSIYVWSHSSTDRTNQNRLKCQFHKRRDSINIFNLSIIFVFIFKNIYIYTFKSTFQSLPGV